MSISFQEIIVEIRYMPHRLGVSLLLPSNQRMHDAADLEDVGAGAFSRVLEGEIILTW